MSCAIAALAEMDAKQYAPFIAKVLRTHDRIDPAVTESALYALGVLQAKGQTADIAYLLKDQFKKGTAAKSLALMGAKDRAGDIVLILKSESPLARQDALLALGILEAKQYEDAVAACLEDADVSSYAAWSLVLMESKKRFVDVLALATEPSAESIFSVRGKGAAQIATLQFRQIQDRALSSLARLKAGN